jgi:hypothetical protein
VTKMREQIIKLLSQKRNLKAKEIAMYLSTDRTSVNRILYNEKNGTFLRDEYYRWNLVSNDPTRTSISEEDLPLYRIVSTIHEIIKLVIDNDSSFFYPKTEKFAFANDYSSIQFNVDYHIISFYLDVYSYLSDYGPESLLQDDVDDTISDLEGIFDHEVEITIDVDEYKGFCVRENKIPLFFISLFAYDKKYNTSFFDLIVHCFEKIGLICSEDYDDYPFSGDDDDNFQVLLRSLSYTTDRYYKSLTFYDTSNEIDDDQDEDDEDDFEIIDCDYCGESFSRYELRLDDLGNYICDSCYDENDFSDGEYIECAFCIEKVHKSSELKDEDDKWVCEKCWEEYELDDSTYINCEVCDLYEHKIFMEKLGENRWICSTCEPNDFESEKKEIDFQTKQSVVESCVTCKYKKNGTCQKAKYNQICSYYTYQK